MIKENILAKEKINMDSVDRAFDEICKDLSKKDRDNRPLIFSHARQYARITCRELGAVLDLSIGEIADIEHGRLIVSDDIVTACFMVCVSKIVVQKEMANHAPDADTKSSGDPDNNPRKDVDIFHAPML